MGLPRIVASGVMRGKQGAQGLPGIGSAAWQAAHFYAEGSIIQAPDGSWLTAIEEHTSGVVFDEDEILRWTPVDAFADSLAGQALLQMFAAKSAQDEIEAGRLNGGILTNRFQIDSIRLGASRFEVSSASVPAKTFIGGFWPSWSMDKDVEESLACGEFKIPKEWAGFEVHVKGCNAHATNLGGVRLRAVWAQKGEGDDMSATTQSGNATLTIVTPGLNLRQSMKVLTVTSVDTSKAHVLRVHRIANDAADTLDNDWRFTGVEIKPTAFVAFDPDLPETPEDLTCRTFTQAMNADLAGLRVWHQNPPPADDADAVEYVYFPGTDYATTQDFTTSTSTVNDWAFLWDNRRNYGSVWNAKPNQLMAPNVFIGTRMCRAVFTTKAKAMAATRAQARRLLGTFSAAEIEADWIAAGGVSGDLITEEAYRASPETYCTTEFTYAGTTYLVMTDKVVLPTPVLNSADPSHKGIMLDYEPGDNRTTAETLTHIQNLAADCHAAGFEFMHYGNPLTATAQYYHGVDATHLPAILDAVDYLEIKLWSKAIEGSVAVSWAAQVARLGTITTAEWAKIVVGFELGSTPGTTLADAEWVRAKLVETGSDHPTKVIFWRNWAQQGGAPTRLTNKKISMICFGTETPPVP